MDILFKMKTNTLGKSWLCSLLARPVEHERVLLLFPSAPLVPQHVAWPFLLLRFFPFLNFLLSLRRISPAARRLAEPPLFFVFPLELKLRDKPRGRTYCKRGS